MENKFKIKQKVIHGSIICFVESFFKIEHTYESSYYKDIRTEIYYKYILYNINGRVTDIHESNIKDFNEEFNRINKPLEEQISKLLTTNVYR